jgi:hypothetical protein
MKLQQWKDLATIFSLVAVPLAIAGGGWIIQASIASEGVRKDYVALAIGVLREAPEPASADRDALRTWAIEIIDRHSPVQLTAAAKEELRRRAVWDEGVWGRSVWDSGVWQPPGWQPPRPTAAGE